MKNCSDLIKPFVFSAREAGAALGLEETSARLACHRYAKRGVFVRLKRDAYVLAERWKTASTLQMFEAANRLQVPSYISLTTALSFYEATTQVQRGYFESIAITRTKAVRAGGVDFRYVKTGKDLYFGFKREKGVFIASPEKALLDALYLVSMGRYKLDESALDKAKLDRRETERMAKRFPEKTRHLLRALWKT